MEPGSWWTMIDSLSRDGEVPEMRSVRFRTLGCYPLTGAVESTAKTLPEIIQEDAFDDHIRTPRTSDRLR